MREMECDSFQFVWEKKNIKFTRNECLVEAEIANSGTRETMITFGSFGDRKNKENKMPEAIAVATK